MARSRTPNAARVCFDEALINITIAFCCLTVAAIGLAALLIAAQLAFDFALLQAQWYVAAVRGDVQSGVWCAVSVAIVKLAAYCACAAVAGPIVNSACMYTEGASPHCNVWAGAVSAGLAACIILEPVWLGLSIMGLHAGYTRAVFVLTMPAAGFNALAAVGVFSYGLWWHRSVKPPPPRRADVAKQVAAARKNK